jgi:hypothetical protein
MVVVIISLDNSSYYYVILSKSQLCNVYWCRYAPPYSGDGDNRIEPKHARRTATVAVQPLDNLKNIEASQKHMIDLGFNYALPYVETSSQHIPITIL